MKDALILKNRLKEARTEKKAVTVRFGAAGWRVTKHHQFH